MVLVEVSSGCYNNYNCFTCYNIIVQELATACWNVGAIQLHDIVHVCHWHVSHNGPFSASHHRESKVGINIIIYMEAHVQM